MSGTANKRAGRRPGRRPVLLVALGLVSSLGAAGALAAVVPNRPAPAQTRTLPIRVMPASRTVAPGASVRYAVRVTRNDHRATGLSGRTRLRVGHAGLPTGSHASLSSFKARDDGLIPRPRTTLTITTAAGTAPGTYEVRLGAHRPHRRGSATVELVVSAPAASAPVAPAPRPRPAEDVPSVTPVAPPPTPPTPLVATVPNAFTIAGPLSGPLTPGTEEPLDLTLTNLEGTDLRIARLDVQVAAVSGPQSDSAHPCEPGDFAVAQFSGAPGFTLPAASTADLGELGFDRSEWPAVSMLDRPVNQDGCKGAGLSLAFTGSATEVNP
jgi:hypothetical protein